LTVSTGFAILAAGFRLPAVVLPVAGFIVMIRQREFLPMRRFAIVLAPLLFVGVLLVWNRHHQFVSVDISEMENAPSRRLQNLKEYAFWMLPTTLPGSALWAVATSTLCLLPLAIAGWNFSRPSLLRVAAMFAALVLAYLLLRARGQGANMPLSSG